MNKKLLFLPLISCALLASCTEEGANDTNNQTELPKQAQGKTVTFKAAPLSVETKSLSTKVEVVPNGNNDDLKWTNETVSFFFLDGAAKKIYTDEADVSVSIWGAEMDVTIPEDPGTYDIYAISPSGSYFTTGKTTLTIDNQTQTGNDLSHLSPYVFLYSNPSTKLMVDENKNSTGEIPLSFDILSSLIRFDIVNNSNTAVTLNSITLKFAGGGTLYKTATLNDFDGTLTYNGETHDEIALTLTGASLAANSSNPFSAYMAAFPSNGQGDLLIDLEIKANGYSHTIEYKLADFEIFKGKRLYVGLDILAGDVLPNHKETMKIIGTKNYPTVDYPTSMDGSLQCWSLSWSAEGNPSYTVVHASFGIYNQSNKKSACPDPWRLPTYDDITNLRAYLNLHSYALWKKYNLPGNSYALPPGASSYDHNIGHVFHMSENKYTYDASTLLITGNYTSYGLPVRCVLDYD
jgi:hypothetical protein